MNQPLPLSQDIALQVIRNVELENALLRTELSLYEREENIKELEQRNSRIQQDIYQRKLASSRAVKQFEDRIIEANKKLTHMNSELVKSQEHARRFQDLLGSERRKQKGLKVNAKLCCHGRSRWSHLNISVTIWQYYNYVSRKP